MNLINFKVFYLLLFSKNALLSINSPKENIDDQLPYFDKRISCRNILSIEPSQSKLDRLSIRTNV